MIICFPLNGQSVSTIIGARSGGLGNLSTCLSDEWSLHNNVGSLGKTDHTIAAFAYDSRPGLQGANRTAFVFSNPLPLGAIAVGLYRFGDHVYSEQILSVGYGNTFGLASLGVKLNYVQYAAEGFGHKGVFSLSAGGLAQLTPQFSIGVHVTNLTPSKINTSKDEEEYIPTLLIIGIGVKASDKVFISAEIEKDLNFKTIWKTGVEYFAHKKIIFRTGFTMNPSAGYFGLGFRPKKFKLDYALRYEPSLGQSHQATIGYTLQK